MPRRDDRRSAFDFQTRAVLAQVVAGYARARVLVLIQDSGRDVRAAIHLPGAVRDSVRKCRRARRYTQAGAQ